METPRELREHFRREFEAANKRTKLTQEMVAIRAGFLKPNGQPNQGQISKLLSDKPYNPRLDVFLKAVQGLGMTMLEFLTRMHQRLERMPVTGKGLRSSHRSDDLTLVVPRLEGPPIAIDLKQLVQAVQQVMAHKG